MWKCRMPELNRFAGIVIYMLFKDTQHLHEEEVYAAWNKAVRGERFGKIEAM